MSFGTARPGDSFETIFHNLHEMAITARRESRVSDACILFGRLVPLAHDCTRADYLAWVLLSEERPGHNG